MDVYIMRNSFRLKVFALGDRIQAIERCRESLINNSADILDFKIFSDMLLNFSVEISKDKITGLKETLDRFHWKTELEYESDIFGNKNTSMIQGTIVVNFVSGKGERKDFIPAVPG